MGRVTKKKAVRKKVVVRRWAVDPEKQREAERLQRERAPDQRLLSLEIALAELRGRVQAMEAHSIRERASFEAELARTLEFLRGGSVPAEMPALVPPRIQQAVHDYHESRRSRFAEIHGDTLTQAQMIERMAKHHGAAEAPSVEG